MLQHFSSKHKEFFFIDESVTATSTFHAAGPRTQRCQPLWIHHLKKIKFGGFKKLRTCSQIENTAFFPHQAQVALVGNFEQQNTGQ